MSEIKVNKISPRTACGTTTLGDSGDTISIPAGVTITNSGTASGFGATGSASWSTTPKTGDFTAVAGIGYFVNTTSGEVDVALPAGTAGDVIAVKDYANTWDSDNCILIPNGSEKIGGLNANVTLDTEGLAVTLVYVDSTRGWLVTDSGLQSEAEGPTFVTATGGTITTVCTNYKVHTFTGPGTFAVSSSGNASGSNTVSYMVVAGGGSGGADVGGGGGAGGFREGRTPQCNSWTASPIACTSGCNAGLPVSVQSYPIVVGAGGTVPVAPAQEGNDGNNSSFSTITSTAGGRGGGGPAPGTAKNGNPGGSGGGGGGWTRPAGCGGPTGPGDVGGKGSGNTPSFSPAQGFNGGESNPGGTNWTGAGGGGATAVGVDGSQVPGITGGTKAGGAGAATSITSSPVTYAAGGSGGNDQTPGPSTTTAPANSGGGGGGAGNYPTPNRGNAGGSGIVVIRYKFQ